MQKIYRQGAVGALLDEYERAIDDLRATIIGISTDELTAIADSQTNDPDCVSIQRVLYHVVDSGFGYATYIRRIKNPAIPRPQTNIRSNAIDYCSDLDSMFAFTVETFANMNDKDMEKSDKIFTTWGSIYDVEQIMEHAIVHILRHRRQIEKFKEVLKG